MPELKIEIGGREFHVNCQPGEERFLQTAARMLDHEARTLMGEAGRLPEARMLLMAGLMLADKTAALDDHIRTLEQRITQLDADLTEARGTVRREEVAVIPPQVTETLAEIAARAEALADQVENR